MGRKFTIVLLILCVSFSFVAKVFASRLQQTNSYDQGQPLKLAQVRVRYQVFPIYQPYHPYGVYPHFYSPYNVHPYYRGYRDESYPYRYYPHRYYPGYYQQRRYYPGYYQQAPRIYYQPRGFYRVR